VVPVISMRQQPRSAPRPLAGWCGAAAASPDSSLAEYRAPQPLSQTPPGRAVSADTTGGGNHTGSVSCRTAALRPDKMRTHSRIETTKMAITSPRIRRCNRIEVVVEDQRLSGNALPAGPCPLPSQPRVFSAMAPTHRRRGLEWKIFCKAAANVALPSQAMARASPEWRAFAHLDDDGRGQAQRHAREQ